MITQKISPPALTYSKNQIPLQLNVPDVNDTAGAYSEINLGMVAPTTEGNTLKIKWSYNGTPYEVVFTFKTTPNPELYEIAVAPALPLPYLVWIIQFLIPGLMAHPEINAHFAIEPLTGVDAGIKIRAIYPADYDTTISSTGFSHSYISGTVGVKPIKKQNFTIFLRVCLQADSDDTLADYIRLPWLNFTPNADNNVDVDLQPYITEYFRNSELQPLPSLLKFTRLTKVLRKLFVEYGMQYGDPVSRKNITRTTNITVLQGGVSTHDFTGIRANLEQHISPTSGLTKFLTNRKTRINYPGQPDHLHFYTQNTQDGDTDLYIRIVYIDPSGSTELNLGIAGTPDMNRGNAYHIPIGDDSLSTLLPAATTSYIVSLEAAGDVWQSEKITIHRRSARTGLTILEYQNSQGVPETIGLPWTRKRIAEVSKSYFERRLGLNYNTADAQRIGYNEMLMQAFELSINQAQEPGKEWLAEILMSPQTHLLVGNTRIPVTIKGDKLNMELQNEAGQHFPNPKITVHLENQVAFSRIINLTNLCDS